MDNLAAHTEWIFLLVGVAVGAVMLSLGILIGSWAIRHRTPQRQATREAQTNGALELYGALQSWTHGFAGDLSSFQEKMDAIRSQIDDPSLLGNSTTDTSVIALIREIVSANEALRGRLQDAETSLADKAKEVSAYLSEARTDQLTKVPNRRSFDDEIARRFSEWQRYHTSFAIMLVDIDHFKKLNDTLGHVAGDAMLQQVANELVAAVRDSDQVARYGGEEFAVILPSSDISDAQLVGQRIVQQVAERVFVFEDQQVRITVSVGAASAEQRDSVTTLIKRADSALYEAKEAGRNRCYYHDGESSTPAIPSNSPLANDPDVPTKFLRICDDLRESVIELTRK